MNLIAKGDSHLDMVVERSVKINEHKAQLCKFGEQKGELSCPAMTAEPNRKNDSSSFLAKTQPM